MSHVSTYGVSHSERTVAIIGIGCRLPGGITHPLELLAYLEHGGDASSEVPPDRWSLEHYYSQDSSIPGRSYVRRGGFVLQSPFEFDPEPFGISPREADRLDPQQRWLLEVTLEAFEDACIPGDRMRGTRTAVFVGGFTQDHQNLIYAEDNRRLIDAHTSVGASMTVLSNRISYTFDLRGPSVTVDTACSGSLVAVHLARQAILHEGCDMAIAGGVNVMLSPMTTIAMCKGHFLSPDGRSKAFDAMADGYGRAEGAAVVVLKRLDLALRDGNPIYAVIHGTGAGQDGRTDGMPMPSGSAQSALIESVLAQSGISRNAVGYVEAHGTGTRVGDPTEATAIGSAYGHNRSCPLRIGSLKSNLGHLEACAGVAGLIKAALAVRYRTIIPQRLTSEVNPEIPFEQLGLKVAITKEDWPMDGPAIAAVNSFGYGGTNAHAILGEWQAPVEQGPSTATDRTRASICVPLSAASRSSLQAYASKLAEAVDGSAWLNQVCTLALHRTLYSERAVVVATCPTELRQSLSELALGTCDDRTVLHTSHPDRRLLWVFTGMGPQWWAMGQQLHASSNVYREALAEVDSYFMAVSGVSLVELMLQGEATSTMRKNSVAQPANFALQVGLVTLLRSLGVPCHGLLGHSVGEVTSAWASGCLSLRDATEIAYHRSRLQQTIAGAGTMLAMGTDLTQARQLIETFEGIEIAAINSPRAVTVAGSKQALEKLAERLDQAKIFHRWVGVEVPYHSSYMDPLRGEFLSSLGWLTPKRALIPLFSTVRGTSAQDGDFDAAYFWKNARQPVLLNDTLGAAIDAGFNAFLEIGPHPVLATSIQDVLASKGCSGETFFCQRRGSAEELTLMRAVASLHACGLPVDWSKLTPSRSPGSVPRYVFTRTRHWTESQAAEERRVGRVSAPPLLAQRDPGPTPRFQVDLASPQFAYLADHRVAEKVVLPAAFYAAMALAFAMEQSEKKAPVQLATLRFEHVLVMQHDDPGTLLMDVQDDQLGIHFYYRHGAGDWSSHANTRLSHADESIGSSRCDLPRLQREHATALDVSKLYGRFERCGLKYGAAFRKLDAVWIDPEGDGDSVLARLGVADELQGRYALHPTILDAAFQAVLALFDDADSAAVPVHIDRLILYPCAQPARWVHARARMTEEGNVSADLDLLAADGSTVCSITGLLCRELESQRERERSREQLYYREAWLQSPVVASLTMTPTSVLVIGRTTPNLERLAAALSARHIPSRLVQGGALDLDPEALSQASHILFYAAATPTDSVGADLCEDLAHLTNRLGDASARLFVVTTAAQQVLADDRPAPAQAALWGFGRVVMTERPELNCRLIDLGDSADASLARLCDLVIDLNLEEESALRSQQVFHRRLQHHHPIADSSAAGTAVSAWRRDRTILVTGGLTGLGLATAKWLADEGADCIVLASRRGTPDSNSAAVIRRLQRRTRIECRSVDVTSPQSVADLLGEIATQMPALGGIFHSAMVLDDIPIRSLTKNSLRSVMQPKALGAWLLHQQTQYLDLDLFVLYSSVSALVGNPNQASYAAANSFLQALAEYRLSRGLAGTCISWGALGDVGIVARDATLETYLHSLGLAPIPARRALGAMKQALDFGMPHVGVIDANWERWVASFPKTPWNRLTELLETQANSAAPSANCRNELAALEPAELRRELRRRISQAAASVLRIDISSIGMESKLNQRGLDSLMAAELGGAIETSTGIVVGTMEILSNVSIEDLVLLCAQRIQGSGKQSSTVPQPSASSGISGTYAVAPQLRDYLLSRICVQPPYFDLEELSSEGEWITATASPLAPTTHERDTVSSAEAARHLAILGSCAVSLAHPHGGRVYYPFRTARRPSSATRRELQLDEGQLPVLSTAYMRARCTHLDLRSSRATAEAMMYDAAGRIDQVLEVDYHLISEAQFADLFGKHAQPTCERSLASPYRSWRPLPPIRRIEDTFALDLGRVVADQCLGHFVDYPAMPVSLMTRDAVRLVAEGVRALRGWSQAQVTVVQGGVTAHAFAFVNAPLTMVAHREQRSLGSLIERWQCHLASAGDAIADIELEVHVHPNLNVTAYPGPSVTTAISA